MFARGPSLSYIVYLIATELETALRPSTSLRKNGFPVHESSTYIRIEG